MKARNIGTPHGRDLRLRAEEAMRRRFPEDRPTASYAGEAWTILELERGLDAPADDLRVARLPLIAAPVDSAGTAAANVVARRRVLVIEDSVDAAESIKDALELDGHEVQVAYDGPTGVELARKMRPDVVLCDIGLPEMDGYAVAQAFRADATLRACYLVALTGYALPEDVEKASRAGFDRHIAKPPAVEALAAIVEQAPILPWSDS